eukprot:scaffold20991_cov39-Phaeocystis_antarctica.AAC.4
MGCCGSKERSGSFLEGGRKRRDIGAAGWAALRAASDAAAPAPVILTKEQQAAKRAAQLERLATLPKHLRLG